MYSPSFSIEIEFIFDRAEKIHCVPNMNWHCFPSYVGMVPRMECLRGELRQAKCGEGHSPEQHKDRSRRVDG